MPAIGLPTNDLIASAEVGLREDLEGVINRVAVEETPFSSNIGTGPRAKSTKHEWELDKLADAADNFLYEGDAVAAEDIVQPTRVANITQIMGKTVAVSGTSQALDEVGNYSDENVLIVKKGLELKRDRERAYLQPQSASAAEPRKLGSFPAWITTNINDGGGAYAAPTLSSGLPVKATDGTQRAFSETIVKSVLQKCYAVRGRVPKVLMVGPFNKGVFSSFAGIASSRFNVQKDAPVSVIGAADVYVGDFGNLTTMPNIFQRERDAFFIDFDMVSAIPLRPMFRKAQPFAGDSDISSLLYEGTLKVHNEAAHGIAADLLTS